MTKSKYRIGFVVPRYGAEILGGAETLARGLAEILVAADAAEVEVFTTCVKNHITWKNELPSGRTEINGVSVHRFPVDEQLRNVQRYTELHHRLISNQPLSLTEQYDWIDNGAHCPEMYAHLAEQGDDFDFLIFIPYLMPTTYYGTAIHPAKSILWPCFHDEIYAYLKPTGDMVRSCLGVMFNTYPEMRLARRLYGLHPGEAVVGFGLDGYEADSRRFRQEHKLDRPILLYSGRLEGGKNVPLLIHYFIEYQKKNATPWKLVLMGEGEPVPSHPDIVPIGFRQGQEKLDAYAAANLLCQPSVNESFSIVIMESWLSSVPILVHADCAVTRFHAVTSNGGLYFQTYEEFEGILNLLLKDEELRKTLGEQGKTYVTTKYAWSAVLERFMEALDAWDRLRT